MNWQFRKNPEVETFYLRYEERSQYDWDYAIAVSRYVSPFQLHNNTWPPSDAIHVVYADDVPLCAVIERRSKDGYYGLGTVRTISRPGKEDTSPSGHDLSNFYTVERTDSCSRFR